MTIAIYDQEPEGDGIPLAYVSPPKHIEADTRLKGETQDRARFWDAVVRHSYDDYMDATHFEESEEGFFQGSFEEYLISQGWQKESGPDLVIHI